MMAGGQELVKSHLPMPPATFRSNLGSYMTLGQTGGSVPFRVGDNKLENRAHKPFHHYFVIIAIRKIEARL